MKKPIPQPKHTPKAKHLTMSERVLIESRLNEGASVRSIARELVKTPSCISREIKKHVAVYNAPANDCANKKACTKRHMCGKDDCRRMCKSCRRCKKFCENYVTAVCPFLDGKAVKVCNGCRSFHLCEFTRYRYEARKADMEYRNQMHDCRCGFDLTAGDFEKIDTLVSPLIRKGLSPYVIKHTLGDEIPVSESTLRRMIDNCELDARRIDLRNAVKRKPRKLSPHPMKQEVISAMKLGHLYSDYLDFIRDNDVMVVQMDCFEGIREDKKVLLTLHIPVYHFQIAFIMEEHTSKCVVEALDLLELSLGKELFADIFGVILTDNGHEFLDIQGMERSITGGQRTKIFFCEPNRSDEKAECETNHKLIRYILPKGTSFDSLVQPDIIKMMNHINNYGRKSLMGKTPYEMISGVLPEQVFDVLGIEYIPPQELNLTPSLLKKQVQSE